MSSHTLRFKTLEARGFTNVPLMNRFRSIGLSSRDSFWLTSVITRWYRSCGIEWTISRLKDLRVSYLHHFGQSEVVIPWIAIKKRLPAVYYCLRKYPRAKILRVLVAYKAFEFIDPTETQVKKFTLAVSRSEPDPLQLEKARKYILDGYTGVLGNTWKIFPTAVVNYPVKRSFAKLGVPGLIPARHEMANNIDGTEHSEPYHRSRKELWLDIPEFETRAMMLEDAYRMMELSEFNRLLFPYRKFLLEPIGGHTLHRPKPDLLDSFESREPKQWKGKIPSLDSIRGIEHVGGIECTQEPGGKLRVFASPFPVLQCALQPLEIALDSLERQLSTDFRDDQEAGARRVQQFLRDHPLERVYCFDLSNATDNFPLSLQLDWMKAKTDIRPILIELFEKVSKGTYFPGSKLVQAGFPAKLKWSIGQPLGTRGSFQAFSLSHSFLLRGIEISLFSRPMNNFCVIGDDVVIFNKEVADLYLSCMEGIGCPISIQKSMVSYTTAEFAGYIIERDMMTRSGRAKATKPKNVRSQAQAYGASMKSEIMDVLQDLSLVDAFAKLPKSIGGFGWTTNQSLGTAMQDITLASLAQVLAEVPEEIPLDTRYTWKQACSHIAGLLGLSLADLASQELPSKSLSVLSKTFVKMPIEVLDSMAYNIILHQESVMVREAFALFCEDSTRRERFISANRVRLEAVKASIQARYWQRPGVILDQPEKVVLEIAYQKAIEKVKEYNASCVAFPPFSSLPYDSEDERPKSFLRPKKVSENLLPEVPRDEIEKVLALLPNVGISFRSEPTRYLSSLLGRYDLSELLESAQFRKWVIKTYMERMDCSFSTSVVKLGLQKYADSPVSLGI